MTGDSKSSPAATCPFSKAQTIGAPAHSEIRFDAVFDHSLDGMIVIDTKGIVERINPATEKIFGFSREQLVGQNVSMLMPPPLREEHDEYLARYISTGESSVIGRDRDVFAQKADGTELPIELAVIELHDGGKRHFIGTVRDVTERRRQERELLELAVQLERRVEERTAELVLANTILEKEIQERKRAQELIAATLREKEVFLKEIHHRVKNNLQLVISILNLHNDRIRDDEALQTILEIRDRIYAIAHLHETLYQTGDFGQVDVENYLRGLVGHLLQSSDEGREIKMHFAFEPLKLTLDDSLPCGLIVNELVLNSLKHAFAGTSSAEISLEVRTESDHHVLITVADNGIGFPESLLTTKSDSIGLHLVQKLTQKLGGTMHYERQNGARFQIRFLPEKGAK